MKNIQKIACLLLVAFILACCTLVIDNGASVAINTGPAFDSYQSCIEKSGGRGHIPSVQWACRGDMALGHGHCTLWLGPMNSSTSLEITADVSGLSGTISAKFYGMCTQGTANTSKIWAENDNGSIATQYSLYRGEWGYPGSQETTIDVGLFVQGATISASGGYLYYSRNITIGRCHSDRPDNCSSQDQTVTIRIYAPPTFQVDAALSGTPTGTTLKSDGKYYTDSATTTITFVDKVKRNNDGKDDSVWNQWWLYEDKSSGAYENNGRNFSKNSGWLTVKTHTRTVNLNQGDNTFCEKIGANLTVSYTGDPSGWGTDEACVTIHRYIWYSWDGKVVPSASGASGSESGGILYVDGNTADMSFSHQLKKSGGSVKTRYKTNRGNTPAGFRQQTNYANAGVGRNNSFAEVYRSPASGTLPVDVAKDDGTQYCQYLYWHQYTREDRGDGDYGTDKIKTGKSTNGCKTIRRYKTTFSATIKVEYKKPGSSDWTTIYEAGSSEISPDSANFKQIPIASENIPTNVEVRFTHTVTRSNSDAHGSPNAKKSYFTTNLDGTSGYRSGDPHGTAVTNKATKDLTAGTNDTHVDTFTVKIYPEQEITLCQKLTYRSEIQGAENTQNATAGRRCFKFTKSQVSCQGVSYGIKNAKNYITMEIYKNGGQDKTSGRIDTTRAAEMVTWVKPGDDVRFKYTMCAAGELASQFADKYITKYEISTNTGGYLFGTTVNDSPYTGVSKTIGISNATPGVGPFSNGTDTSHKYEYTTASPSDGTKDMYKCSGGRDDYYRIHDIRTNNEDTDTAYKTERNNCKADDYQHISDAGQSFYQKATWSDIWYSNGSAVAGHTGGNATVIGRVNVPYNYSTEIKTTAAGGNVVLGQSISAQISLKISKRVNSPVQATSYATYSKKTRYSMVRVVIPRTSNLSASTYNTAIKNQEYSITDNNGGANLAQKLSYCGNGGIKCTEVINNDSGFYYKGDNTFHNLDNTLTTLDIPDYNSGDYAVGTKICYVAGIWPSDSHGFADPSTAITESNQAEALKDTGSRWHISSPSCFAVVKRPTLSALGGDLYAPSGIVGVTTKRGATSGSGSSLFGSWSEFGLISGTSNNVSKGEIKGFASGASLWGGGSTDSGLTRECYFSSMTFANANCDSGTKELGKVPVNASSASYPERLAERIRTRYTDSSNNDAKTDAYKINDAGGCVYDANSNSYVERRTNQNSRFICLPGGAKYMHATADVAYIDSATNYCMIKGDTNNSRTAVIEADHTLVIGTNNVYGNTVNTGKGRVPGTGCYKEEYKNISEIPQSIYIADTIILKDSVERMESWLIANTIYTCDPRSGYKAATDANDPLNKDTINANNCYQSLFINGPVIAKNLHLYRTGGGNGGTSNATPSEIFYLGPEAYLWSYNQAQRYSQATTTYQREIAPRY